MHRVCSFELAVNEMASHDFNRRHYTIIQLGTFLGTFVILNNSNNYSFI